MINLQEYFDINLQWKNEEPKIKFNLKVKFKENKVIPRREDGMPISGACEEYYIHYLGDIGHDVWIKRKSLLNTVSKVRWYIDNIDNSEKVRMSAYLDKLCLKISKSTKEHYNSPLGDITREKLKRRSDKWKYIIGKRNSERWKDPIQRERMIEKRREKGTSEKISKSLKKYYSIPENAEARKIACNNPKRIKKISDAAKQMWENAKKYDVDKYYRMINSSKNKKYVLSEIKMNSIEYMVGTILNQLNVRWEYERVFHLYSNSYRPDFYIPDKNLVIEAYGDFWHGNPLYFTETDFTHKNRSVQDVWNYDKNKKEIFEKCGFIYYFYWENDIINNFENVLNSIKSIV